MWITLQVLKMMSQKFQSKNKTGHCYKCVISNHYANNW